MITLYYKHLPYVQVLHFDIGEHQVESLRY